MRHRIEFANVCEIPGTEWVANKCNCLPSNKIEGHVGKHKLFDNKNPNSYGMQITFFFFAESIEYILPCFSRPLCGKTAYNKCSMMFASEVLLKNILYKCKQADHFNSQLKAEKLSQEFTKR